MVMLLVGTVMALGTILSFWGTQLVQTRLNATTDQTPEEICAGGMFRLYSGSYDKDGKELIIILENQRGVDLDLKTLYLFYPDKKMESFELNRALQSNMILSVPVEDVEDGFETGTIKTNCAEVTLDFTYSDVT